MHVLDGKQIDCKKAVPKDKVPAQSKPSNSGGSKTKENRINDTQIINNIMPYQTQEYSNQPNYQLPIISDSNGNPVGVLAQPGSLVMQSWAPPLQSPVISEMPSIVPLTSNNLGEFSNMAQLPNQAETTVGEQLFIAQTQQNVYNVNSQIGKQVQSTTLEDPDELQFAYNSKKIFVGGLPHGLTEIEFKTYFQQYGNIDDWVVMYDRNTGKPRGFGFVTYSDERSVDLVMKHKLQHKMNGKWIEWKRATPKTSVPESNMSGYYDYEGLKDVAFYTYSPEGGIIDGPIVAPTPTMVKNMSIDSPSFVQGTEGIVTESPKTNFKKFSMNLDSHQTTPRMHKFELETLPNVLTWSTNDLSAQEIPKNERLSDGSYPKQSGYFTKLIESEENKPILEKIENIHFDEDKITTYDEMFENNKKSENGSDWNISLGDPFEIKEIGFPQPLPTSDVGSIFNKYGSGYVGVSPPDKTQLPEILNSHDEPHPISEIIKQDLINLVYEDDIQSDSPNGKNEEDKNRMNADTWENYVQNEHDNSRFKLDRCSNPHFPKYRGSNFISNENPFTIHEPLVFEMPSSIKTEGKEE